MSKKVLFILLALVIVAASVAGYFYLTREEVVLNEEEAKQAVDTSYQSINNGSYAKTENQLREAIESGALSDPGERYQALVNLGISILAQGRKDEAFDYLIEAETIKGDETAADVQMMIGNLYVQRGENEKGVEHYKKAIARVRATPEEADDGYIPNYESAITGAGGTL